MVAPHERHHLDLAGIEAAQPTVADEVLGVPVPVGIGDVPADVMKERGILEQRALRRLQTVPRRGRVEQAQGEGGHLPRVRLVEMAALGQGHDAAAANVGVRLGARDRALVARQVVEQQPLAQRPLAEDDFLRLESVEYLVQHHGAGHDDVGAPLVHEREPPAALERGADEAPAQRVDRGRRHRQVVE